MNISANKDLTISRNGVSLVFTPSEFKRGDNKKNGVLFPGLEVSKETLPTFIEWMSEQDFFDFLNPRLAQLWQNVYYAATDDGKKEWSAEDNASMLEKLSTRGESKAVIDAKVKSLIADLNDPEIMMAMNGTDATAKMDALTKFKRISADLKKFSDILESKKRVKTGDEDEDEASTVAAAVNQ